MQPSVMKRSPAASLSLIVATALTIAVLSRVALGAAPALSGALDDLGAAALVATLLFLAAAWAGRNRLLGRVAVLVVGAVAVALAAANGWYFSFYRGFLGWDSAHLLRDAGSAGSSVLQILEPATLVTTFAAAALLVGTAVFLGPGVHRRQMAVAAVASFGVFLGTQGAWALMRPAHFTARSENPLARLVRTPTGGFGPRAAAGSLEGMQALASLLPPVPFAAAVSLEYPLHLRPLEGAVEAAREDAPLNVLIVMLESVRASEMGLYGNPRSATPNLDALGAQGLVATSFYANATQTIRAETSVLCGVLDVMGGAPIATTGTPMVATCLPSLLKQWGYRSHWFHGNTSTFFSRDRFMPGIGFDELHDVSRFAHIPAGEHVGWGPRDAEVLSYALDVLERHEGPFFAEVMTLSNHHPFNWEWPATLPDPVASGGADLFSNYRRGIAFTDHELGVFWERFERSPLRENTLVMLLGDHGIWTFPPEDAADDFRRHEQYFRVPFIAVGPGVPMGRVTDPVSQVDVAPTILSLLGIRAETAFLGRAFAGRDRIEEERPVFTLLEQAYGFRKGDLYCYPVDQTCFQNMYPVCDGSTGGAGEIVCARTSAELLHEPMLESNTTRLGHEEARPPNDAFAALQALIRSGRFVSP